MVEETTAVEIPADMELTYEQPDSLTEAHTHYCPGCTHGTIHRLIAEVLDVLTQTSLHPLVFAV